MPVEIVSKKHFTNTKKCLRIVPIPGLRKIFTFTKKY